ncbi:MAG TPA: hypothetical protein VFG04_06335 [Planctomycetaceae bacterium]|jgi:hypothetical protein|nr:hypothetical protein [Planctomycetaceae bacterium]
MHPLSRHVWRLALAAALLSPAGAIYLPDDGDDDDLVEIRDRAANQGQIRFGAAGQIMITERNIDGWIYGSESRDRGWLEASLKQKIEEMGRVCELSDAQKQKLTLAGKGDIQRFTARVDDLKATCKPGGMRPEKYTEIFQKTRPLHAAVQQGLFGSDSLFHKTQLTALRPEQSARCERLDRERRAFRYRARVEMCIAQLDTVLGLRDEQRRRLLQLVITKTRPPKAFGQYDRFIVLAQMSRLPEDVFKSELDPAQWAELRRRLITARRTLPMLKQNGLILDDADEHNKDDEAAIETLRRRRAEKN